MKAKIPFVGDIRTGKDAKSRTYTKTVEKVIEKSSLGELGAGFLDLGNKALVSETTVSTKLINSFKGWVFANVSVLAEEVSKMEFELYKVVVVKGETQYQEIKQHPLLDLLDKPNPFTTTSQLMYQTEAHLELTGDEFYLLDRAIMPTKMFILQPDKITVNPGDESDEYMIKSYTYKTKVGNKTKEITYAPELIIHNKTPNPGNAYRGKSVVEAAAITIDTDNLAREFIKKFFENGASPNFALSTDQRLSDSDITRITAMLKKSYGGVKNAFNTMILSGGIKPVTVQQSNKEIEFQAMQIALRDEIMAMFKNTKASLGIVEDVNRANAEATLLGWKQSVIKPKMGRIVDTLNEFLVPKFGDNLLLSFCDPVPENKADDIKEVTDLMATSQHQVITINEAREMLDLDPLVGPEFDTINNQLAPTPTKSTFPKSLKNINYEKHMRQNGINKRIEIEKNLYAVALDYARKLKTKNESKKKSMPIVDGGELAGRDYANFNFQEATDYWAKIIQIADVREKRFEDRVNTFLDGIEKTAIRNLHLVVGKSKKLKRKFVLFDEQAEVNTGIDLLTPLALEIAELSGSEVYQTLNLSTLYNPSTKLTDNVKSAVDMMVNSVVSTDKDKLSAILEAGIKEGQSVPQIEQAIRAQFGEFKKNQSTKIARTELIRYSNQGQLDAFEASGVVMGKQWYTARDGKVDEECAALDGTITSLGKDFFDTDYGSGEQPPLHPNCRCVLLPVIEPSKGMEDKEYIKVLESLIAKDTVVDSINISNLNRDKED